MPVSSQAQWKYIWYLRNKYGSKEKTPEKDKWIWKDDKELFGGLDFEKLPKKVKGEEFMKEIKLTKSVRVPNSNIILEKGERIKIIKEAMSGKRALAFTGEDEVGDFWVVEYPRPTSRLDDICYDCDVFDFALQVKGGLEGSEVYGIYRNKRDAMRIATGLLGSR